MTFVRRLLRAILGRAGRALLRAERALVTPDDAAAEQRAVLATVMAEHDMVDDPDEAYYRERYWEWLEPRLPASGTVLDAGCGSGRLTVPIAQRGLRVVGVDFLAESIDRARRHVAESGVQDGVELVESDLLEFLRGRGDGSFDAVVFLEVGLLMPALRETLGELQRVLRPGGALLASLRTRWYLAAYGVGERDWEMTEEVLAKDGGPLPGIGWQNWSSSADAVTMLEQAGFADVELFGVGAFSGIEGDPQAELARPSLLDVAGRRALAQVEDAFGATHPDAGRYVLAFARRR